VNTVVALPTNIDTKSQLFALVIFLKKAAPMHFFWDQMVKGELGGSHAQRTLTGFSASAMLG
jgi:hypothetical protein